MLQIKPNLEKLNQDGWWRGAVIYQVYPRSFMDTNDDGIGDLPGIVEKLDYIADLGVDAIWISPFFKSPMRDFGYDISDYRQVDPIFGTIKDFEQLVEKAHRLGLKVIVDQVLSHTSCEHQWFKESSENKSNDKADWYVWADPKEDGSCPNNWMSIFGGSAWEWEPRREQYYLHNFLTGQPDLNFHNAEVVKASLDNIEFWLKKGVDGFRLDAINFCFHSKTLKDNPFKPIEERKGRGFSEDNPYAFQYHFYDNTQPENLKFIKEIRQLLDKYPNSMALGEIQSEDPLKTMAEYTQGEQHLHMGYSFELLTDDFSAKYIRETVQALEQKMEDGWPCWAISNHDVKRVASRWCGDAISPQKSKLFIALLCSLRGSICTYQGEELGLTEAEIEFEDLRDPYGINFWPNFKGRDGCRTPMPWSAEKKSLGFTKGTPWLPIPTEHADKAVDIQLQDKSSVLNGVRDFLLWRKSYSALINGEIEFLKASEPILAFVRKNKEQSLLLVFNLSNKDVEIDLNQMGLSKDRITIDTGHGLHSMQMNDNVFRLKGFSLLVGAIDHISLTTEKSERKNELMV